MENNTSHNYLEELLRIFNIIGFKKENSLVYKHSYYYKKTIELKKYNHSSDLEWLANFDEEELNPSHDNINISLKISLFNNRESVSMPIKNFIEYLKHEFKYQLRSHKVNKLLQNEC